MYQTRRVSLRTVETPLKTLWFPVSQRSLSRDWSRGPFTHAMCVRRTDVKTPLSPWGLPGDRGYGRDWDDEQTGQSSREGFRGRGQWGSTRTKEKVRVTSEPGAVQRRGTKVHTGETL